MRTLVYDKHGLKYMNRRSVIRSLMVTATPFVAGCTGGNDGQANVDPGETPRAWFRMKAASALEIAEAVTYDIGKEHRGDQRELAISTIEEGPTTVTASHTPFPANAPFIYGGSVHELSYEDGETFEATEFRISLSETDEEPAETIAYDDLPEVDAEKFAGYGWDDGAPFEVDSIPFVYRKESQEESVLVPDPDYGGISWEDTKAEVAVEGVTEKEFTEYEYTVETVADSVEAYGNAIREEYEFTLSDPPEEEEQIVAEAIEQEDGYVVEEGVLPESFGDLIDRITAHDEVPGATDPQEDPPDDEEHPLSGSYVVRYDGTVYWSELYVGLE